MKIFCFLLFFLSSLSALYAQLTPHDQLKNDSLLTLLKTGHTDSIRARAAFHLSKLWIDNDSTKGVQYLQQGKILAKDNEYLNAIYRYQSIPSYKDKQEVKALLAIFNRYKNPDSWDYAYRLSINRVTWLINQPQPEEAIAMLQQDVIPLVRKLKKPNFQAEINLEMGRAFYNQGMNNKAVPYLEKSAAIYESIQPKDRVLLLDHAHTLTVLANVYHTLMNDKADSVIQRTKSLLKQAPSLPQELRIVSLAAMRLNQSGKFQAAEQLINQTLAKTNGVPVRYLLSLHFQRYKARMGMGDYRAALHLLQQSHPIDSIQHHPTKYAAIDLSELLPAYAKTHEKLGDYKQASAYWQQYIQHRDSVSKDQIAAEISKLEVQLRTQEKDAAIQTLEAAQSENALRLKNQRILNGLFAAAAVFLLTVLGFILYIYRSKQRANKDKIQQIETDSKLGVANALLEGEERERQRIARDLHDSLGGSLAGIRIQLSASRQEQLAPDPTIDRAIVQLEHAIAEVRRIARNMIPESLLARGLDTALQDLCAAFSPSSIHIEYQSSGLSPDIPILTQTNIYRVVQELLVNAVRHGKASQIIVQCIQEDNRILLTVEDDGQGFKPEDTLMNPGIGLQNIQRRVDYMQGQLSIESEPGEGTAVNIEIHVD